MNSSMLKIFTPIAAILSIIPLILAYLSLNQGTGTALTLNNSLNQQHQLDKISSQLDNTQKEIDNLNVKIDALSQISDDAKVSAQLAGIDASLSDLKNRFSVIEGLIIQNPVTSLEIPFMRKDIDDLSKSTDIQLTALKQDIDRTYYLVIASIVALALAIIAPSLGNLFRKEKEKDKEKG